MDSLKYFGELYGCTMPVDDTKNIKAIVQDVASYKAENFDGDQSPNPFPTTLEELIEVMDDLRKNKKRMKATSTNHSREWCNIIKSENEVDVNVIDFKYLRKKIEMENATTLKDSEDVKKSYCCYEAGATISAIQNDLWPCTERKSLNGKVLLNQTGCVDLSIGGTIATAAHGNGLDKPIIADMVRSFRLITVQSDCIKQYQLEPTIGITNKEDFSKNFKGVELIQDDNYFYAALVNIGSMGIVYSYILEIEDAFYLKENRTMMSWKDAKGQLKDLFDDEGNSLHSFELFVCPYPPIEKKEIKLDDKIQVVICKLEKSEGPPKGTRPNLHFVQPEWIRPAFTTACDKNPEILPLMICLMMNATQCKDVVMDACEALDPLSGLAVSGEVRVSECAMKVESADDMIRKVDDVIEIFQCIRKKKANQLVTTPFAVRFSKESKAFMAMQYNRPSMMIISNILKGTPDAEATLKTFRDSLMNKHGGRPHWGMIQDMDKRKLEKLYGKLAIQKVQRCFENV
ncbi:uncharacterized protein LOC127702934 [Mytilus californianus]|uniref:uncharacterized protein LOC127702934 n=1 Tax=Mytilus californianus TaxID=6549 RepID=UPI0022480748|nr:uncharacterized protein LOC127702934 [Mytilus californianus]